MAVDESLRKRLLEAQESNRRQREESSKAHGSLELGSGGGDSGGMDGIAERVTRVEVRLDAVEDRMGRLETRMDRLDTRMDGIDNRLRGVEQTLAAINGKLDLLTNQVVSKLPSWWQMPAVIGSTVVLLVALWAAAKRLGVLGIP